MTSTVLDLPTGATLACTGTGSGRPVLLLHGVCMSRKFFERNIEPLAGRHRVIALDFRGHGGSPSVEGGHTVAQYARDVRAVIEMLDLRDAVLVGWSMGSMVLWDYLGQFAGDPRLAGAVVVSQGPSDLTQPGWPYGIAALAELRAYLQLAQDDFAGFFAGFVPEMFIPRFTVPHLLVWGRDEKWASWPPPTGCTANCPPPNCTCSPRAVTAPCGKSRRSSTPCSPTGSPGSD
jgi:pimeloyl-ACP methyl ester carboxylesterase